MSSAIVMRQIFPCTSKTPQGRLLLKARLLILVTLCPLAKVKMSPVLPQLHQLRVTAA